MRAWVLLAWLPLMAHGQADGGVTVITGARVRLPGTSSLRGAEARDALLIEHDAAKAVQTLPGVGRAALGSPDLVVFGAAPAETRVELDGVEVPSLFHLGGYRSVVASMLVGRLELEPAALQADVGRGVGGLVRVETAAPPPGVHGEAAADVSGASAWAGAGSEEASLAVAGRVSTLAAAVGPFLQGAAGDRFALPRFWDAQVRGSWSPAATDELVLLGLSSADALSLDVGSDDPSLARGRTERSTFHRLALTWRRGEPNEGLAVTAWGGLDQHATDLVTPLAGARAQSDAWLGGIRARWRGLLVEGVAATCGFDGRFDRSWLSRKGPLTLPPREGDVTAFGAPLSDDRAADAWRVSAADAAVFAGLSIDVGRLTVAPSVRLAAVASDVSRSTPVVASTPSLGLDTLDVALEPRLTAAWSPAEAVTLSAAAGLTHQAPDASDRSAVFGTPALTPSRGAFAVGGVHTKPASGLSLEATAFARAETGLAVRDPAVEARLAQVLLATAEGRALGLDVAARGSWNGPSLSLSYTLSRSERRQGPGAPWRLADFDQTHVLVAGAGYSAKGWRAGARLRWATGFPRTPVIASFFDVRRGVFEPAFGAQSSTRLPDFLQLDLEAGRTFTWERWSLEVYVEAFNVTDRANVEEWVYDSTFSRRGALTGLPAFGTLGVRGWF